MPGLLALQRYLRGFYAFGAGMSMAGIFLIVFVNSVRRYPVGKSLTWGEELPIYLAIYGIMFGASLAYLQDRHVRFTVLIEFFSERTKSWVFAIVDLLVAVTGALLAYSGYLFMTQRGSVDASGLIQPAKELAALTDMVWIESVGRMATWQFAVMLGGVLLALAAIVKGIDRVRQSTRMGP